MKYYEFDITNLEYVHFNKDFFCTFFIRHKLLFYTNANNLKTIEGDKRKKIKL